VHRHPNHFHAPNPMIAAKGSSGQAGRRQILATPSRLAPSATPHKPRTPPTHRQLSACGHCAPHGGAAGLPACTNAQQALQRRFPTSPPPQGDPEGEVGKQQQSTSVQAGRPTAAGENHREDDFPNSPSTPSKVFPRTPNP
jgi:hypothetical protein